MFVSFRLKILAAFLALLSAVGVAGLAIVSRSETRRTESDIRAGVEVTRVVFASILERRERQLATSLKLLGGDFAFKQALSTQDNGTIESAAVNFQGRIGADAVWVTDDEGTLYADTTRTMKPGTSIAKMPVVARALREEPGTDLHVIKGSPYQIAAVPILAPDLVGVLLAGFRIDDAMAAELRRLTLSEVSFAAEGKVSASTLAQESRRLLEARRGQLAPGAASLVDLGGERHIVLPVALSPDITVYIQRSWDAALAPLRELQRVLGLIGLAGFVLTALAGYLIAKGVTASVAKLVRATEQLVKGDYSFRVDIRSRDEIGTLGSAFNQMVEGLQEREKIRSVLRKTVSKEIADELLRRGQINLGGEEREVTVLFSDIRGFTTISEGLSPQDLVSQLNAYFISMARAIEQHRGVIDKYVGDAIMALYGAPLASPEDADNAQRAALAMVSALEALNAERARQGLPAWNNGIGLNTGRAVAGTMGSEDRWSYTVIGDSVNLSSRLEGLTKHYGARVLVSQATRAAGKVPFLYRSLDLVRVKGKNEPVEIFELLGEGTQAPAWLAPFEEGVRAYRARDFQGARVRFEEVLAMKPGDLPAQEYLDRLAPLLIAIPADWEPAHTMHEK